MPTSRIAISAPAIAPRDRKSTRLNSSHLVISYAVFCLKKKKNLQDVCHHRLRTPRLHAQRPPRPLVPTPTPPILSPDTLPQHNRPHLYPADPHVTHRRS